MARSMDFFDWECVSLVRRDYTTFDLVVKDKAQLDCLIKVVSDSIYRDEGNSAFLRQSLFLRLEMRLQFEAWSRNQ